MIHGSWKHQRKHNQVIERNGGKRTGNAPAVEPCDLEEYVRGVHASSNTGYVENGCKQIATDVVSEKAQHSEIGTKSVPNSYDCRVHCLENSQNAEVVKSAVYQNHIIQEQKETTQTEEGKESPVYPPVQNYAACPASAHPRARVYLHTRRVICAEC